MLTASSAMVKTMTPEVIHGAFYFPEAKPRENGTFRGSPIAEDKGIIKPTCIKPTCIKH